MVEVPHVETLSDYLRIAEAATVIELPLADDLESALAWIDGQWFLVNNSAAAQPSDSQHLETS